MTQPTRIGEGRFATPLELLPGERVLWSGGPEPRSAWVHLSRLSAFVVLPILFAITLLVLPSLNRPTDDQGAASNTQAEANDCNATSTPACGSAAPAANEDAGAKPDATAEEGNTMFFRALIALSFMTLGILAWYALATLADCFLRVRRAWYVITSERICIQSGGWSRTLAVMDLDKVISVKSAATWFEARLGLQTIELTHASGTTVLRNAWHTLQPNAYAIAHVPTASPLLSELVNHWLPRDNRVRVV